MIKSKLRDVVEDVVEGFGVAGKVARFPRHVANLALQQVVNHGYGGRWALARKEVSGLASKAVLGLAGVMALVGCGSEVAKEDEMVDGIQRSCEYLSNQISQETIYGRAGHPMTYGELANLMDIQRELPVEFHNKLVWVVVTGFGDSNLVQQNIVHYDGSETGMAEITISTQKASDLLAKLRTH